MNTKINMVNLNETQEKTVIIPKPLGTIINSGQFLNPKPIEVPIIQTSVFETFMPTNQPTQLQSLPTQPPQDLMVTQNQTSFTPLKELDLPLINDKIVPESFKIPKAYQNVGLTESTQAFIQKVKLDQKKKQVHVPTQIQKTSNSNSYKQQHYSSEKTQEGIKPLQIIWPLIVALLVCEIYFKYRTDDLRKEITQEVIISLKTQELKEVLRTPTSVRVENKEATKKKVASISLPKKKSKRVIRLAF